MSRRASESSGVGAALDLLERARATLLAACRAETTTDRYIDAHLGALRAAAALLAATPRGPRGSGGRVSSVWDDLTRVAPELEEWATYFALVGRRRAQVEAGSLRVGPRESDDTLRAAETFMGVIQAALGLPVTRAEQTLSVAGLR